MSDNINEAWLDDHLSSMETTLQDLSISSRISCETSLTEPTAVKLIQSKESSILDILQVTFLKISQKISVNEENPETFSISLNQIFEKLLFLTESICKYCSIDNMLNCISGEYLNIEDVGNESVFLMFKIAVCSCSVSFQGLVLCLLKKNIASIPTDASSSLSLFDFLYFLNAQFESGTIGTTCSTFVTNFLTFIISHFTSEIKKSSVNSNHVELLLYSLDTLFDFVGSDFVLNTLKNDLSFNFSTDLLLPLESTSSDLKKLLLLPKFKKSLLAKQHEQLKVTLINSKRFIIYLSQNK